MKVYFKKFTSFFANFKEGEIKKLYESFFFKFEEFFLDHSEIKNFVALYFTFLSLNEVFTIKNILVNFSTKTFFARRQIVKNFDLC